MSIFVGNISKNVRSRDLDDQFDKFGPCNINYKGSYAFITFESEGDAQDALNELQGKNMGGLKINIEWSRRSGRYDPSASRRPPRRSREQIQCYTCGERGHYARECYQHRYSKGRRPRGRSRSDSYRRSDHRRYERRSPSYSSYERSPEPYHHSKRGRHHRGSYSDESREKYHSRDGRDRSASEDDRRDYSKGKRRVRQRSREHEVSEREKRHSRDQDRSNSKEHRGPHQRVIRSISSGTK